MIKLLINTWRRLPENWRLAIRRPRIRALRKLGLIGCEWDEGKKEEVIFWEKALSDGGKTWDPALFNERMNSETELSKDLQRLLESAGNEVDILDVGAGPLTWVGKKYPGRVVKVVAVDPLADEYSEMLDRLDIHPPVRTSKAFAEKLTEVFPRDSFNLAHASNALDHASDPILAISEMLAVTKVGGHVYLWHFANEGENEGYSGLHQWNFNCVQGDTIIGNGHTQASLREKLGPTAEVASHIVKWRGADVVVTIILKKG